MGEYRDVSQNNDVTEVPVEFINEANENAENLVTRDPVKGEGTVAEVSEETAPESQEGDDRIKELEGRLLRLMADFENYRRRTLEQQSRAAQDSKAELLKSLLPVLDDFSYLVEHLGEQDGPLAEGAKLIHQKFVDVLRNEGLEPVGVVGESFDPELHEAINVQRVNEADRDQKIFTIVKQGYRFRDRIIRPCQVVVGQYSSN